MNIAILTYNRLDDVKRCLQSVADHTPDDVRVSVLDNGSTDGTILFVEQFAQARHNWTVSVSIQNLGVGGGRNQQLVMLAHDDIVFLDSDTVIESDTWIERLEAALKPENVGVVGIAGSYVDFRLDHPFIPALVGQCDVVSGWCMAVKMEAVTLGSVSFDPAYGLFWEEDSDFCLQVRDAGWDVVCIPNPGVQHYPGKSGDGLSKRADNLQLFRDKWRGKGLVKLEGAY